MLAAGRAVGLGEDEGDFVACVDEGLEAGNGEFGGSAEDEFHGCGDGVPEGQGQRQKKKQIPGGNDRKKGKGNDNYMGFSLRSG